VNEKSQVIKKELYCEKRRKIMKGIMKEVAGQQKTAPCLIPSILGRGEKVKDAITR
jgi:hypothetical protein